MKNNESSKSIMAECALVTFEALSFSPISAWNDPNFRLLHIVSIKTATQFEQGRRTYMFLGGSTIIRSRSFGLV